MTFHPLMSNYNTGCIVSTQGSLWKGVPFESEKLLTLSSGQDLQVKGLVIPFESEYLLKVKHTYTYWIKAVALIYWIFVISLQFIKSNNLKINSKENVYG